MRKQVVLDRLLASAPVYGERNALGHFAVR